MSRNTAHTILFLYILVIWTSSAALPRYVLHSMTEKELVIGITLPPGSCKCAAPFFMAFTTVPGTGFSTSMMYKNENVGYLTHQAAGWSGNYYLQWCSYNPEVIPCADTEVQLTVIVTFSEPILRGLSRKDAICADGIIRLPVSIRRMGKKSTVINEPLFTSGLKIAVENDGIYELTYDQLRQYGVPVEHIGSRTYRLFEQEREIPLYITNEYHSSLMQGDRILFYGTKLRSENGRFESYSETNIYWLTWGGAVGMRMPIVSGARRIDPTIYSTSRYLQPDGFNDTLFIEVDNTIVWLGNVADRLPQELIIRPGDDISEIDNWYWGEVGLRELTNFKFDIPSPVARGTARLSLGIMGLSSIDSIVGDHSIDVFINDVPVSSRNHITWDGQRYVVFESDTFSTDHLLHGNNQLTLQTNTSQYTDRSALDWVRISYTHGYEALDNKAYFTNRNDSYGKLTEYTIAGFTTNEIELWDITHHRFFTGTIIEDGTGKQRGRYTLVFQDSVSSPVRYFAQATANRMAPAMMQLDTIITAWDTLASYDYLAISVDSFATVLEPLLDIHRKEGYRTAFVDIDDLYNRFTYGIRNPESIRFFLQYLYEKHDRSIPRFLLLGGDATHDLDKKNRSRTIVPVHLSRIPGWGPGADDSYFTYVNNEDFFPDCCIGRLPAQNCGEMKKMVEKTISYITDPDFGYWRDNVLLLGGGEPSFTEFNDMATHEAIGTEMHIERMDADPGSIFYKDGFVAPKRIADHINAGMFIVNFNGHGGGNIWSDNDFFGYNDLSLLHNGEWKGGRLPVVFSFTCLTGFFESTEYRSLGEEFIRLENDGAIAFYGASAYTSQKGNIIMNRLFLEEAVGAQHTTIGELINYCEMSMLVRYQTNYIDLVRQYNLLGDPALPLYRVPDTLRFSDTVDNGGSSLVVDGTTAPIDSGQVKIALVSDHSILDQIVLSIDNGKFDHEFSLKEGMKATLATIRTYAWNDGGAIKAQHTFIKDTIVTEVVTLDPARPSFNDSVYITCKFISPEENTVSQVYCMYAVTGDNFSVENFSGIPMKSLDDGYWGSNGKVYPGYRGNVNDRLTLFFRVLTSRGSLQTDVMTFNLKGRPDVAVVGKKLAIQWVDDSLRIPFEVENIGNAASPPYTATLCWSRNDASPDTFALVAFSDSLAPGKSHTSTVTIADTMGNLAYFVQIDPYNTIPEIAKDNNRLDGYATIAYRDMRSPEDTLRLDDVTALVPAYVWEEKHRLFILEDTIANASPLATSSIWRSQKENVPIGWDLEGRPAMTTDDSLEWTYTIASDALADTAFRKTALMVFDTVIASWRYECGLVHGKEARLTMTSNQHGRYAIASLSDIKPPELMATIYGKSLLTNDYAAKDRPFSLFLSDPSSVLPQSVVILLNNNKLPSESHSSLPTSGNLSTITIAAYPQVEKRVDSLTVQCSDLAGNLAKRTFAYLPGADLCIKSFSCHPNPFTARKNENGTISKIRFAFLLTDVATTITLSIFTVSGKKIRTWSEIELIGYQQIEWDGRDYEGYRIANGTYYAKLFVKNNRKKDTKIIRIAKLEGF